MNTPTPSKNETAVRLYDEAQVFEGSRPSGLLIQGGDEILRLERELAAVTEQRDRLAEEADKWEQIAHDKLSEVCRQIEKTRAVTEQRDEMARAIIRFNSGTCCLPYLVDLALQSLNQPTP